MSNMGWFGAVRVTEGHRKQHQSIKDIQTEFLLAFHSNYVHILNRFLDMARYCRKSPFVPTPPLFGAPIGVTLSEFRRDFWRQKTIDLGYRMALLA